MKRSSGHITPFTTYPQATHGEGSSSAKRIAIAASALLVSARSEVVQVSPGVVVDRPPEEHSS